MSLDQIAEALRARTTHEVAVLRDLGLEALRASWWHARSELGATSPLQPQALFGWGGGTTRRWAVPAGRGPRCCSST